MDENAVVKATCVYLETEGFEIKERRTTVEKGIDIVAENSITGVRVFVEAKGNTSSIKGTAREGKDFDANQVLNRVSKGVFTCLQLRANYPDRGSNRVLLAVPDSRLFRFYLEPVKSDVEKAGIEVLFI